ncbi:MAG: stage II sporulation protein M [Brevinema sp.]
MKNNSGLEYFFSFLEFVAGIVLGVVAFFMDESLYIQTFFVSIFSKIPVTFGAIFLANTSSMIVIYYLGLVNVLFVTFFLLLNGMALGTMVMLYFNRYLELFDILIPHAIFETCAIISFCGAVKCISDGRKHMNPEKKWHGYQIMMMISIPLFIIALVTEVLYQ